MDKLIKALIREDRIRVYITKTTDVINEAIRIHDLWPSAASVLGKTMSIALMMGAMLKGDEAVTIKIDGNGPIGIVVADSNAKGTVRGYISNPHIHFSRRNALDDITTLGYNGYIDVIKDLRLKEFYQSSIPLETGDLAKDFAFYFTSSEQTPTLISLGILMKEDNTAEVCGGIIIQLLPNAKEEDIVFLESKTDILKTFSSLLIKNNDLQSILKLLFEENYRIIEEKPVYFRCDCSKEKFARGISSLGTAEIQDIIDSDEHAEVVCHYCKKQFYYNKEDLEEIKKGAEK